MTSLTRLQRAYARSHIALSYADGIYTVRNETTQATILLPASLPLEAKAVQQLLAFAAVKTPQGDAAVCAACATPDFHPGTTAPVGSVVATPQDVVIPAAIGTDINCGMRLLTTGLSFAQAAVQQRQIIQRLKAVLLENARDVPTPTRAFKALFDDGPAAFLDRLAPEGLWAKVNRDRLSAEVLRCVGLDRWQAHSRHAPTSFTEGRDVIRDPCLGTPGAGNHFVELQVVEHIFDKPAAYQLGLRLGDVVLMIHSGSRDLGFHVGARWMDRARQAWPTGVKHPESRLYALHGPLAADYLEAMGVAARYAWANRVVLAEMVRHELSDVFGGDDSRLVVDVPHNVVLTEQGLNIHRKGATPAHAGQIALIPGSMGDSSYVARGLGHEDWLWSCSHGAGRRMRRQDVRRLPAVASSEHWHCVTLREERRIEEAPHAYKPIGPVIDAQTEAGLIESMARLRPWLTFKA